MGYLELTQASSATARRFPVYLQPTRLGCSPDCEICLPIPVLRGEHALLDWDEDLPWLLPLSPDQLLVSGRPIPRGAFLAPGDRIDLAEGVSLRWIPEGLLSEAERPDVSEHPRADGPAGPRPAPAANWARVARKRWRSPDLNTRAEFFADLLRRLEDGEPLGRAMEAASWSRLPALAQQLSADIYAGHSLSEALGHHPDCFTPYELGMLAAGEEGGMLERQLRVLASSMQGTQILRDRLCTSMLAAFLVLGLSLPCLVLLPVLRSQGSLVFWTGVLASMVATALGVALLVAVWYLLGLLPACQRLEEEFLARLPILGPVLRLRAGGRFLRSLGPLLTAGLPLQRAALLASGCTGSPKYTALLLEAARKIEAGSPVLDSLAPTGLLTPRVLAEVGQGEYQGNLPERLAHADQTLREVASRATLAAFNVVVVALSLLLAGLSLAGASLLRTLLMP